MHGVGPRQLEGFTVAEKPKGPTTKDLAEDFFRRNGQKELGGVDYQTLILWREDYYLWEDGVYRLLDDEELKVKIVGYLNGTKVVATPDLVSSIKLHLSALTLMYRERVPNTLLSETDRQKVMVPVHSIAMKNGPVSFGTDGGVHFEGHSPNFFNLTRLPYGYDSSAGCPRWRLFIEEVTMGDMETQRLLQQWAGYLLTPTHDYQCFLLCLGDAATGKGSYERAIMGMLGRENCSGVSMRRMGDKFSLYHTYGKMLNVAGDAEEELTPQVEGVLKEWTGVDPMLFERKYGSAFSAQATAKLMISANSFPAFTDKSGGTWRRLKIAKFRREHPEIVDTQLDVVLAKELPGIFNWAVEGLKDLKASGCLVVPKVSQEIWHGSKEGANPAGLFLVDHYKYDPAYQGESSAAVYGSYREWCLESGYRALSDGNFGKEVFRAYPRVERTRHRKAGRLTYIYSGLSHW